jgi:hypothetical protein
LRAAVLYLHEPLGIAMVALAIGAPLYGTVAATHHRSWRPLFLGVLVALVGPIVLWAGTAAALAAIPAV